MLELEGAFMTPVTSPAIDRFTPGGALSAGALFAPLPFLLPSLRLRGGVLGDGPAPQDRTLRDPGVGGSLSLTAGVRLRPVGLFESERQPEATGFWAEIDLGMVFTGVLIRPQFELGVGWAFELGTFEGAGLVELGPVVRFVHVLQTEESGIDGNSTYLVTIGAQAVLFDAGPLAATEEAATPDAAPRDRERLDTDGDGIHDDEDACPNDPEDADGWQDEDGCPDPDDDGDGILDATDQCPRVAEDADGWQDADGCPDPDNDGDGILDGSDQCPDQPETVNGNQDDDGCPDEGLIELIDDRIVLEEEVLFALNRSRIRHQARPVLQAVVTLIQQHPEWALLRVEGHADAQGEEEWNLELSRERARRVREALIELGVPEAELTSEGYGSSHPRVEGTTEEAYQANRRVEIVVVERRAQHGSTP
jgi:outer membrane protein OmpA-like peptidoglycan-associated protein